MLELALEILKRCWFALAVIFFAVVFIPSLLPRIA